MRRWPNYSRGIRLSCAGRRLSIVWSGTAGNLREALFDLYDLYQRHNPQGQGPIV